MNKQIEFLKELKALLEKYEAEVNVEIDYVGYGGGGILDFGVSLDNNSSTIEFHAPRSDYLCIDSQYLKDMINKLENQN